MAEAPPRTAEFERRVFDDTATQESLSRLGTTLPDVQLLLERSKLVRLFNFSPRDVHELTLSAQLGYLAVNRCFFIALIDDQTRHVLQVLDESDLRWPRLSGRATDERKWMLIEKVTGSDCSGPLLKLRATERGALVAAAHCRSLDDLGEFKPVKLMQFALAADQISETAPECALTPSQLQDLQSAIHQHLGGGPFVPCGEIRIQVAGRALRLSHAISGLASLEEGLRARRWKS